MHPIGWLFLLGLYWLVSTLYRRYRLDQFREQLFELRDSLFDLVVEGGLQYSDRAYGQVRSMINGSIQYAHKLGFIEILLFAFSTRAEDKQLTEALAEHERRWKRSLSLVDDEAEGHLQSVRDRLHAYSIIYVVETSPVLLPLFWLLIGFLLLQLKVKNIFDTATEQLRQNRRIRELAEAYDYSFEIGASWQPENTLLQSVDIESIYTRLPASRETR